jgi:hypothetical protein
VSGECKRPVRSRLVGPSLAVLFSGQGETGGSSCDQREDAPKGAIPLNNPLVRALSAAAAALLALAALLAVVMFPHTSPWVIRWKVRIIGCALTYGPLAYDDDRSSIVLNGVRTGNSAWLSVASGLRPTLDTHPGEEMLEAVSTVFDTNPAGALHILVPNRGLRSANRALSVSREDAERGRI